MLSQSGMQSPRQDVPYWSPVETMPRAKIEALQQERFRRQIDYCWQHSRWYRKRWESCGLTRGDVKGLEDIQKLPVVTKEDLRESQEKDPPYGMMLADGISPTQISRIGMTSGTTGKPVLVPFTADDYDLWMEGVARCLWACGVRSHDIVHPAFGFVPFAGLAGPYDACERWIGSLVVPGGAWDTVTRISMIPMLGVTVLMGTPTYLLHLARTAAERGVDVANWPVRMIWVTGEPGPMSVPSTGQRLRDLWQVDIREFCGTQETNYWAWTCSEGSVHWNEDLIYAEILDPETRQPVGPGEPGDIVVTDLCQRTHPLIRFPSGDRVAGMRESACPCGRTLKLFDGFRGRIDNVVKVHGVSVSPVGIENVVRAHPETSDNYEIEFYNDQGDGATQVLVRVEPARPVNEEEGRRLAVALGQDLRAAMLVRVGVQVVAPGTLPVYELKARRIVDKRSSAAV